MTRPGRAPQVDLFFELLAAFPNARPLLAPQDLGGSRPISADLASANAVSNGLERKAPRKPGMAQKEQAWSQPSATRR